MSTRDKMRQKIIQFCEKPRTHREVAENFGVSGISAAAFLSGLRMNDICIWNPERNTFKTRRRFLR